MASTRRTSCTPRTWTCAGAPTTPGGGWASPAPAAVTHVQGVSTARHPYRMMVAHHRSALRFTLPDDQGLAAGRAAPGRARARGAHGLGHRPAGARPLARAVGVHRGWLIAAIVAIGATVLALGLAAAVSGPHHGRAAVHVEPEVTFALPPASAGCGGVTTLPGGAERIPLTVSTVAGQVGRVGQRLHRRPGSVPLRPRHRGGAVDHRRRLGAAAPPAVGRLGQASSPGVGCTGTAQPVAVGSWSLDGVSLAPQQVTSATLPQIGGKGEPVGPAGLRRAGALRRDPDRLRGRFARVAGRRGGAAERVRAATRGRWARRRPC